MCCLRWEAYQARVQATLCAWYALKRAQLDCDSTIDRKGWVQILTISFPGLKKMQREDGPQGRARYQLYQKLATLAFATVQAFGQLSALRCGTDCCSGAIEATR